VTTWWVTYHAAGSFERTDKPSRNLALVYELGERAVLGLLREQRAAPPVSWLRYTVSGSGWA
jgi:hypothetical protein